MRLDSIFLPRENPCAKFYIIIILMWRNFHMNKIKNLVIKKKLGKQVLFSLISKHHRLVVVLMSCSRLFNNFGAANIKAQLPRVFDDFIGGKRSKVPSQQLRRL